MYEVMVASVSSNPGGLLESCVPSRKREVAGKMLRNEAVVFLALFS
jgi:hypothetical protein